MRRRKFVSMVGVAASVGATGCTGNGSGDGSGDGGNGADDTDETDETDGDGGENGGETDSDATDLTGQDEVEVSVGAGSSGFRFDPADIVVGAGTAVRWVWTGSGGSHNVTHADGEDPYEPDEEEPPIQREAGGENPLFKSELVNEEGHEFTYTFEESGTYDYVCTVHVSQGMSGSVEVQ